MLNLARNLKNNTLAAQNIIKQDNQVAGCTLYKHQRIHSLYSVRVNEIQNVYLQRINVTSQNKDTLSVLSTVSVIDLNFNTNR